MNNRPWQRNQQQNIRCKLGNGTRESKSGTRPWQWNRQQNIRTDRL